VASCLAITPAGAPCIKIQRASCTLKLTQDHRNLAKHRLVRFHMLTCLSRWVQQLLELVETQQATNRAHECRLFRQHCSSAQKVLQRLCAQIQLEAALRQSRDVPPLSS
jgi:hypothetical protein